MVQHLGIRSAVAAEESLRRIAGGADAEWIARPPADNAERGPTRTLVTARRIRAALRLVNAANLCKATKRVRRGEFRLLAASLSNVLAERTALEVAQRGAVERFEPVSGNINAPLVTIVIPCFNDGRYVREALASALGQTFADLEVIVVDGGSTDGTTPAVVASLTGPRVRTLIRIDGRHLVGDNRNFGIAATRSRYICCLDSDDVLEPTYIEKVLFQMEYRAFDVGSSSMREFGARTGEWLLRERPTLDDFRVGNQTLVCSVFRRSLWAAVGGYRDTGLGRNLLAEDWDFWLRLAAYGARFVNVHREQLLNYRVREHGQQMTTHPEMLNYAEQGHRLLERNRDVLTGKALALSRRQARRVLHPAHPEVGMRTAMRSAADAAHRPTLLLAIPFFVIGGAERLLSAIVAGLIATGWRVVVVSTEFEDPKSGDALPWFTAYTAECYALPRFLPPDDWRDFVDYLFGSRQPDALLIAGSRFLYGLLPRLAATWPAMARLDLLFNSEGHVDMHMEYRALLTGVLCESQLVRTWLHDTAKWSEPALHCISSGVDTTLYTPGPRPEALAAELGIEPSDIVVGWSGRLSEEKSPETFVELAARCRDLSGVHFVMTGDGPIGAHVAWLADRLPRDVRFHQFGLVEDIGAFYRLYDIYILTSRLDGRPLSVMEAQASGCAVLAARVGSVPEIMEDGVTGALANPGDAGSFEHALRGLVADRERLSTMRAAARLTAERFSISAMVDSYRAALEQAVAAARLAAAQVGAETVGGSTLPIISPSLDFSNPADFGCR
jgi:glycosyltransferase involved in cell wall biosynthesis